MKRVTITITNEIEQALIDMAKEKGMSVSQVGHMALAWFFDMELETVTRGAPHGNKNNPWGLHGKPPKNRG